MEGVALVVVLAVNEDVVEINPVTERVTAAARVATGVCDPQEDAAALADTTVLRVGCRVGDIDVEDDTEAVIAATVTVMLALLQLEIDADVVAVGERVGESVDDCVDAGESENWALAVASGDCVVEVHAVGENDAVSVDEGERLLRGDAVGDGVNETEAVAECESVAAADADPVFDTAGLVLSLELAVVDAVGLFDEDVELVVELDTESAGDTDAAAVEDALPVTVVELDAQREAADEALGVPVDDALVLFALLREPTGVDDGENVVDDERRFDAVNDALAEKEVVARADAESASLALFDGVCFDDELATLLELTLALIDDVRVLERLAAADCVDDTDVVVELDAAALLLARADMLAVVDGLSDIDDAVDTVAARDRDAERDVRVLCDGVDDGAADVDASGDCDGLELSPPLVDGAADAVTVDVATEDVEGARDEEGVNDAAADALGVLDEETVIELRGDVVDDADEDIERVALDDAVMETESVSTLVGELVPLDDGVRVAGGVALVETDTRDVHDTVEVILGLDDVVSDDVRETDCVMENVGDAHDVAVPSARDAEDVVDLEATALVDGVDVTLPVSLGDFVESTLRVKVGVSDGKLNLGDLLDEIVTVSVADTDADALPDAARESEGFCDADTPDVRDHVVDDVPAGEGDDDSELHADALVLADGDTATEAVPRSESVPVGETAEVIDTDRDTVLVALTRADAVDSGDAVVVVVSVVGTLADTSEVTVAEKIGDADVERSGDALVAVETDELGLDDFRPLAEAPSVGEIKAVCEPASLRVALGVLVMDRVEAPLAPFVSD